MNKYKIEFSEELKKYGLKDFIVTTQADKQDYLEQIRYDIYMKSTILLTLNQ